MFLMVLFGQKLLQNVQVGNGYVEQEVKDVFEKLLLFVLLL